MQDQLGFLGVDRFLLVANVAHRAVSLEQQCDRQQTLGGVLGRHPRLGVGQQLHPAPDLGHFLVESAALRLLHRVRERLADEELTLVVRVQQQQVLAAGLQVDDGITVDFPTAVGRRLEGDLEALFLGPLERIQHRDDGDAELDAGAFRLHGGLNVHVFDADDARDDDHVGDGDALGQGRRDDAGGNGVGDGEQGEAGGGQSAQSTHAQAPGCGDTIPSTDENRGKKFGATGGEASRALSDSLIIRHSGAMSSRNGPLSPAGRGEEEATHDFT